MSLVLALSAVGCGGPVQIAPTSSPAPVATAGVASSQASSPPTPGPTPLQPDLAGKFDVGGHSLYIECYGTDGPVAVFDAGSGGTSALWKRSSKGFIGLVDNRYRRCLYDRANLGQSDRVAGPRTSATAAEELHTLLHVAGLDGPYVLVGRSFGGYNVRLFAAAYPLEIRALILIETLTPEFHVGMKALLTPAQWADEVTGLQATEPRLNMVASELLVAAAKLRDVPLLVIAGTKWHSGNVPWPQGWPAAQLDALWDQAQQDLGKVVPRGRTVVFQGGDHSLQISQPERLAREINDFLAGL